ncbi:MAG: addiction module HigA family antidote [Akkermansiaceae bacterium]|jgi:addiction module HigA family antidote
MNAIKRDPTKIPRPLSNQAAGLIEDTLAHFQISASEAYRAMQIPRGRFTDIFKGRKGVSADTALRLERYLGLSAQLILKLQAEFDFQKAYHTKREAILSEVQPLSK